VLAASDESFFNCFISMPNPLLQELPLWFLLRQRQSFLIRGPTSAVLPSLRTYPHGLNAPNSIRQFALFQHRVDLRQTSLWTIGTLLWPRHDSAVPLAEGLIRSN